MIEQTAILEIFEKGGISMWPLLFLSILSLSTILERLVFWLGVIAKEKELVNRVLEAARYDWQVAQEIAKQAIRQPIGRFLYAPLRLQNANPEVFRLALESAADNELAAMRRGEKIMETVIALSPLLGLLGTVLGLINSLGSIRLGDIGTNATRDVTTGIGEALISTAAGLIVAIMTLAFYRIFQGFLFSQMKMFNQSGNELELLYRQFWDDAQNNPGLMPRSAPSLPKKTDSNVDNFVGSGNETGRLSETPLAEGSGSLSNQTGRLSETPLSEGSGSLSNQTGRLSETPLAESSGSLPLAESKPSIPENLSPQSSLTGADANSPTDSEPSTDIDKQKQKEPEVETATGDKPEEKPEETRNVDSSTQTT